jgi:formyltetrahydrofolate deformylase
MRILSPDLCAKMTGRIINIHHSFLPSFKGARPYQRVALARAVRWHAEHRVLRHGRRTVIFK